jgi:hypothetical protein
MAELYSKSVKELSSPIKIKDDLVFGPEETVQVLFYPLLL